MAKERKSRRKSKIKQAAIVLRFGQRLRELRLSLGLSQAELAGRADLTGPYVGHLERGHAAPGIDLVDRLAQALGTTAAELLPSQPRERASILRDLLRNHAAALANVADEPMLAVVNLLLTSLKDAAVHHPGRKESQPGSL